MKKVIAIIFALAILFCSDYALSAPSPTLNLGNLSIIKRVTIDGKETHEKKAQGYMFRFLVVGPYGYHKTVSITVKNGHNSVTLKGLEPGEYRIVEFGFTNGFRMAGPVKVEVNFNATSTAVFKNEYIGQGTPYPPWWVIEDYMTALGIICPINHCGDAFD